MKNGERAFVFYFLVLGLFVLACIGYSLYREYLEIKVLLAASEKCN